MKHVKHMAIGALLILGALVLFGVPLATAARYAAVLACPVMMVWMMIFMNHGQSHGTSPNGRPDEGSVPKPSNARTDHNW